MFFFKKNNKNKKFPYFPKNKIKKNHRIKILAILLFIFFCLLLNQNKKQIKTEVKAQKVLGASTIKKIKKSVTPTLTRTTTYFSAAPIAITVISTPTITQNQQSSPTSIPPTPPTSPIPTSTPTQTPTPPTPTPIDDIIIRPSINPKTTISPLPTSPIFPPEQ